MAEADLMSLKDLLRFLERNHLYPLVQKEVRYAVKQLSQTVYKHKRLERAFVAVEPDKKDEKSAD